MHVTCVYISTPPVECKWSRNQLLKAELPQHRVDALQMKMSKSVATSVSTSTVRCVCTTTRGLAGCTLGIVWLPSDLLYKHSIELHKAPGIWFFHVVVCLTHLHRQVITATTTTMTLTPTGPMRPQRRLVLLVMVQGVLIRLEVDSWSCNRKLLVWPQL
jgi:hypothetical protein